MEEARRDKQDSARPELAALPGNFDRYDEIFLGYPNYCGTMPMAVYTFLESFDFTGKKIYPFCTHEGSGLSNAAQIKAACKGATVLKGLAVYGHTAQKSPAEAESAVDKWLSSLAL